MTETRDAALRDLVQRYLIQEHAIVDASTEQKIALLKELELMRNLGMAGFNRDGSIARRAMAPAG